MQYFKYGISHLLHFTHFFVTMISLYLLLYTITGFKRDSIGLRSLLPSLASTSSSHSATHPLHLPRPNTFVHEHEPYPCPSHFLVRNFPGVFLQPVPGTPISAGLLMCANLPTVTGGNSLPSVACCQKTQHWAKCRI